MKRTTFFLAFALTVLFSCSSPETTAVTEVSDTTAVAVDTMAIDTIKVTAQADTTVDTTAISASVPSVIMP